MKFDILRADRSGNNESEAQDMAGCLADGERVIAYFPTLSALRYSDMLAAAPELLDALITLIEGCEDLDIHGVEYARQVIAKAEGRDA